MHESWENPIEQAAQRVIAASNVVALTGAGLSVESGIPPFRGPGGIWTKYGEPPMNGYELFLADPKRAWEERLHPRGPMRELWLTLREAQPNPGHHALAELEQMGRLRCLITQNIDDLHRLAGSRAVAEIHGNYTLVRCIECLHRLSREEVDLSALPPRCPRCGGIMKSDTVSFGEPIPRDVLRRCFAATEDCDCILVAGTSATVFPAAQFPITVRERGGALIEINPHETEISRLATISIRANGGAALPSLVAEIRAQLRNVGEKGMHHEVTKSTKSGS